MQEKNLSDRDGNIQSVIISREGDEHLCCVFSCVPTGLETRFAYFIGAVAILLRFCNTPHLYIQTFLTPKGNRL